ncbi:MAG: ATP-binding protein [Epsilonproteobacteria bacterium]|nr:hypothetical protein [Campylobacterota bacterium]NPA56530.1 ATP-binding protein [Campylobacterota bacterium]
MANHDKSYYLQARDAFIDSSRAQDFIKIDSSVVHLERLKNHYEKPFKFILIHSEPGLGKTILLQRLAYELDDPHLLPFFKPFFSIEAFKETLSDLLFDRRATDFDGDIHRLDYPTKTIILDEAQLYDETFLEFVRVLSDTQKFRFILSMHQNANEQLFAKEHFKTRIFDTIVLSPPTPGELLIYIQKKLLNVQLLDLAKAFGMAEAKYIHSHTRGNFRLTNRFLFTLFDIMHYFDEHRPSMVDRGKIDRKFLEMSALYLGYIDA